jgi:hypothetical protein
VYVSPARRRKQDLRFVARSAALRERQVSHFARALWPPDGICPRSIDAELDRRNALRPAAGSTCAPLPATLRKPPPRRTAAFMAPWGSDR